jgi:hypothetical protein
MRLLTVAVLAALLCTACASFDQQRASPSGQQRASPSGATLVAGRGLTDEERCLLDRGVWRAGHCETCGGGM